MDPAPFVFADLPIQGTLSGAFVASHPGSRIDAIHLRRPAGSDEVSTLCWVRGATSADVDALVLDAHRQYGNAERVQGDEALLVVRVRTGELASAALRSIVNFSDDAALWWDHFGAGRRELRAQMEGRPAAEGLAHDLNVFYRTMGIEVRARVGVLPAAEVAAWRRLSQWRSDAVE